MQKLVYLLLFLLLALLFALPITISAQGEGEPGKDASSGVVEQENTMEETLAEHSEEGIPQGISLLFLLMGLGGVFFVGIASIGKDRFTQAIEIAQEAGKKL